MATPNQIKHVSKRIERLVHTLLKTKAMVKGSFSTVHRRCGKPTCWCADHEKKGHPSTRITWTEKGISHTKTVKEKDVERLRNAVESYRTYRRNRRQLRAEENLLEELLGAYEQNITEDIQSQ